MNAPFRILDTPERYRLRVEDFLLLDESGAFADYTKTELIDGEVFGMNAQHSQHARAKSRLLIEFALQLRAIGSDLEAISEVTVRTADDSAPEPDIVLTRWRGRGVVPVETVALLVEVADTTLSTDVGRKAELYAAAGVPEYWVVDVNGDRIVIHSLPTSEGYEARFEVPFGGALRAATIDGLDLGEVKLVE